MALLRAALAAIVLAGCYGPAVHDCDIHCSASRECPDDTTCGADGWCHVDLSAVCLQDGGVAHPDARPTPDAARPADAAAGAPDARVIGAPDAPVDTTPDAPVDITPDAPVDTTPDAPVDTTADAPVAGTPDAPVVGSPDAPVVVGPPDAPPAPPDAPVVVGPPDAPVVVGPPDAPASCVPEAAVLDNHAPAGYVTSISIDASDVVTISYINGASGAASLWAQRRAPGGAWQVEKVGPCGNFLKGQAVDENGGVHVAYTSSTNTLLLSSRDPGGGWSTETIESTQGWVDATIAVTPTTYHVAAWEQTPNLLRHFQRERSGTPGTWSSDDITSGGGEHPSLAAGTDGQLHVSFKKTSPIPGLGYANLAAGGVAWTVTVPDPRGGVGNYTALAVDRLGLVHIIYSDYTDGLLLHMEPSFPDQIDTVDTHADRYSALVIDGNAALRVSTYDYTNKDLRTAQLPFLNPTWSSEALDTTGDVGRHSGIVVDSTGATHISYHDDTNGTLRYLKLCP
jgi:hypothetical protein